MAVSIMYGSLQIISFKRYTICGPWVYSYHFTKYMVLNLYTSEGNFSAEACDLFVHNLEIPTLRDEERDNLEGPLTYDECRKALETFQNDKAPGEDGFTIEFYKYL